MANDFSVTKFIDIAKMAERVEEGAREEAGRVAENFAKRFVQVDNGTLRDSIEFDGKEYISANTPYAAVQEYGAPGYQLDPARKVGFGYTPYLRPAAQATAQFINREESFSKKVIDAAIRFSLF